MKEPNLPEAREHFKKFMEACGLDTTNPHLQDTPVRFTKMLVEATRNSGRAPRTTKEAIYDADAELKVTSFEASTNELVIVKDIEFSSICAHHFAPFFGQCHVGYIPNKKIIGISKLARITDYFCLRPQTQEILTEEIAEFVMQVTEARFVGVLMSAQHTCYSADTEILTEEGFVPFPQLSKTAKVAQFDQYSGEIKFKRPSAHVELAYSGKLIHFKADSFDLLVTPDHRCLVRSEWDARVGNNYGVKLAKEVESGYMLRSGEFEGKNPEFVQIGKHRIKFKNYCKFMGAYLSEGCFSPTSNAVRVKQDRGSKGYAAFSSFFSSEFEIPFRYTTYRYKGKERGTFICYDKELNEHLKQFGKSADKFVPKSIKHASWDCRFAFLNFYWQGDGGLCLPATTVYGYKLTTTLSRKMADDLQEMLVLSNIGTSLNSRKSGAYDVAEHVNRDGSVKRTSYLKKSHIKEVPYSGKVYCVTVPSGFVVVRRNGRIAVSGNCMSCRGPRKMSASTVTSKFLPPEFHSTKAEFLSIVLRQ